MATLHASRFTLHASRFIKGFRSAALIGVVSLSLAACGSGGDSTVTAPAPVTQTPPDNQDPDPDCTAVPRPAGCPDREPVVPMPLAGLGEGPKLAAAIALREVADTYKVQLADKGATHLKPGRLAVHGLQLKVQKSGIRIAPARDYVDTKIAKVTPSGSGDNIAYSFELYNPEIHQSTNTFTNSFSQVSTDPFEHEIFSLKGDNAYTSVKRIESIATQFGEDWDYSILKASVPSVENGDKDATLYAELWTDYASAGKNDYMVGGWWLLALNNDPAGDYRFGALAKGEKYYSRDDTHSVKPAVIGDATYKGNAAGLHTSSENGMVSIQRLLGKVTLTADFGNDSAKGTMRGEINNLTLDSKSVQGQILLPSTTFGDASLTWTIRPIYGTSTKLNPKSNIGNIKGVNYRGDWLGTFLGDSSGNDQPTGIVGVVGGSGGGNSFVASFGAKKVETGE